VKVLGKLEEIEELGGAVVAIVHDTPARVRGGLLDGLEVPFPVLVDADRRAYRAWGMRRSSVAGVWLDPRVWWRYVALMARGSRPRRLGEDTLQLGGDFVLDAHRVVTYARPQTRDDRPPVHALLAELRRASGR
jgi:hypothetical protein